ncbi:protein YgfX [Nitrosomonas marina]|uniref:protein YgfX n=1 Tax=Nitrosomonas marina TaxID=917 RepID=UPI003528B822
MLRVKLGPSRLLVAILIVTHSAAAVIVGLLSVTVAAKLAGMLALIVSLYFYIRCEALQISGRSAVLLEFTDKVICKLKTKNGQNFEYRVSESTFVSPYLTVLILRSRHSHSWSTQSIVILPDAINSEEFRRLRVLLRWKWKQLTNKGA